jgi:hypothetical protein
LRRQVFAGHTVISLADLPRGSYVLQLKSEVGASAYKVIAR